MLIVWLHPEGWKAGTFAALEWTRSGSFARRSGGQTRGVPSEFSFLSRTLARRTQPALWSGDCGPEVEKPIPQVAAGLAARGGPPREAVPRKFSRSGRQRCNRGRRRTGSRDTRYSPRFGFNSPGRRTRTAQLPEPRSSTVGANFFTLRVLSRVGGDVGGAPAQGVRGDLRPLSPGAGTSCTGAGITRPAGRVAARAPSLWAGRRARESLGFGNWMQSPSAFPGGRRFRQKKTRLLFQACENFAGPSRSRVAGSKARL